MQQADSISLRVLLVEDNEADAELMGHALASYGFNATCTRVDTAEQYVTQLSLEHDIILCDYGLPTFSALEALRLLHERPTDIPLIVVSGSIRDEAAVRLIKAGADDYLLKDRMARLGAAVTSALEAKRLRAEARRVEEDLRQSELKYRTLFEYLPEAACISLAGKILDINPQGEELLHLDRSQALGKSLKQFLPPQVFLTLSYLNDGAPLVDNIEFKADGKSCQVQLMARTFPLYNRRLLLTLFRKL